MTLRETLNYPLSLSYRFQHIKFSEVLTPPLAAWEYLRKRKAESKPEPFPSNKSRYAAALSVAKIDRSRLLRLVLKLRPSRQAVTSSAAKVAFVHLR